MYVHVKTRVKMFADFHQLCISVLKFREISQCGIQMSHSVKNYYSFRQMISSGFSASKLRILSNIKFSRTYCMRTGHCTRELMQLPKLQGLHLELPVSSVLKNPQVFQSTKGARAAAAATWRGVGSWEVRELACVNTIKCQAVRQWFKQGSDFRKWRGSGRLCFWMWHNSI